jgi:hypothetical protein
MAAIDQLELLAGRKAADRPSAAAPTAAADADEDDLPIPSDINTVLLGGLFVLAMLAACYVAAEIVLPIVLAFVLSLVLTPAMKVLQRVHLPRGLAAMLVAVAGRHDPDGGSRNLPHWEVRRSTQTHEGIVVFNDLIYKVMTFDLTDEETAVLLGSSAL